MINLSILLKAEQLGIFSFIIILSFFSPFLFVFSVYIKSKLNKSKFINEFIKLAAYVIKSDGDVSQKEIRFVHYFLEKQFGNKKIEIHKKALDLYLKSETTVNDTLKDVDDNQDPKTKIQLLHFLVKIAIIDGYLKNAEFIALSVICHGIGLKKNRLISILAMHSYITEKDHNQQNKKQRQSKKRNTYSSLDGAYTILELDKSATDKEIKKSYRKLVVLYHPDKIMKLSKYQKDSAKELYLKINEAYEYLKKVRGFK
jgi:DnaJ like chaperone protein